MGAANDGTEGWGAAREETGGWGAAWEGTEDGEDAGEGTGQQGTGQDRSIGGVGGGQNHYHPYLFSDLVAIETLNLLVTLHGMISTAK